MGLPIPWLVNYLDSILHTMTAARRQAETPDAGARGVGVGTRDQQPVVQVVSCRED